MFRVFIVISILLLTSLSSYGQTVVFGGSTSTGGGNGTIGVSQAELSVTRTSSTVLTVGTSCSASTPCIFGIQSTVYQVTSSCTATISSGTSTLYIKGISGGTIALGGNFGSGHVVGSGCTYTDSVTSFDTDGSTLPIWSWHGTSGTWDSGTGTNYLAYPSSPGSSVGTGGIVVTSNGLVTTIDGSGISGGGGGNTTMCQQLTDVASSSNTYIPLCAPVAGTYTGAGTVVRFHYWGIDDGATNASLIKFGSTILTASSGWGLSNATSWDLTCTMIERGATSEDFSCVAIGGLISGNVDIGAGGNYSAFRATASETLSGAPTLSINCNNGCNPGGLTVTGGSTEAYH